VVLLVLATALVLALDSIVAAAVAKGGQYALGVPTRAGGVALRPFAGEVGVSRLEVSNPPGFRSPYFLRLERAALAVAPASLLEDVVEVPSISLDGLEVYLERGEKGTNYGAILASLERFESKEKRPAEGEEAGGKKFVVREVVLTDLSVHTDLVPELGSAAKTALTIPEIRLHDVGNAEGGASVAELTAELVRAVLAAVLSAGGELLPDDLLQDLERGLTRLGAEELRALRDQIGGSLGGLGKGLKEGAGKTLGELEKIFK
jgi:hypothetical protein